MLKVTIPLRSIYLIAMTVQPFFEKKVITMKGKILITGATGTIGTELVLALQHANANFVAGVRDIEKAKRKFAPDTPLIGFDFEDSRSFVTATEGVDQVFLLGPPLNMEMDKLLMSFIDFLKSKALLRVVYLSAFGSDKLSDLPFHKNVIEKLKKEGFHLTVLLPNFFSQNFKNYEEENILKRKIIYSPAGKGKTAFVDVKDIGEVAAKVLTTEAHTGKEYILTGPESLSYEDAAKLLSEVTKEKIVYPAPSPAEYTQTLKASGAPDFIASYMTKVYSMVSNGYVDYVSTDVEKILNRKPGSLKSVLEKGFARL